MTTFQPGFYALTTEAKQIFAKITPTEGVCVYTEEENSQVIEGYYTDETGLLHYSEKVDFDASLRDSLDLLDLISLSTKIPTTEKRQFLQLLGKDQVFKSFHKVSDDRHFIISDSEHINVLDINRYKKLKTSETTVILEVLVYGELSQIEVKLEVFKRLLTELQGFNNLKKEFEGFNAP